MAHRWSSWLVAAGALAVGLLLGGCSRGHGDLLVVSTADCQGYLEPCG